MKDKKNPVFITYINPKEIYNNQGIRLDTVGVATVVKEDGRISHGLSIKSVLDVMNRKKGSDMAIGRAISSTPCLEYLPDAPSENSENPIKELHKNFVEAVKEQPERFILLQAQNKKEKEMQQQASGE